MAGRAFAFADPEIIQLASEQFIPVCADDWYQRRRQDAEGEFFRSVANQGPRKGQNNGTRQGIYTLTADGELLEYKNAGQDVEATREQLKRALRKWQALPARRTQPGSASVPEHGPLDPKFARVPPADGLVLAVHARILDRVNGEWVRGRCDTPSGARASRDFLWLTREEAADLIPKEPVLGQRVVFPARVARRLARFHLVDNTRGEPNHWHPKDVRELNLTLTVVEHTEAATVLAIAGVVKLANEQADRGYEANLAGIICFRRATRSFERFELLAVGDHWGDDSFTQSGARPGRTPLGISFYLVDAQVPALRVAPQAARDLNAYFAAE